MSLGGPWVAWRAVDSGLTEGGKGIVEGKEALASVSITAVSGLQVVQYIFDQWSS